MLKIHGQHISIITNIFFNYFLLRSQSPNILSYPTLYVLVFIWHYMQYLQD